VRVRANPTAIVAIAMTAAVMRRREQALT